MTTPRYARHDETLALMRRAPVIPVLTVDSRAEAVQIARALAAGGLPVVEITLRTAAALEAIRAVSQEAPETLVGAGTVLDETGLSAALAAGAGFIVTPGVTDRLAAALIDAPTPVLPGAATVSEMMALRERGFRQLKFFPAESSGGVKALSSMAGPLGDLTFCPTGGIDAAKAPAYLALKNVACVGGSWMVPKGASPDQVRRLAEEAARLAH
jgi:2-dehydro-3-deoxyphosphogluconate aldolase/(4S)-4-hydroxy-2-oxoglutarate aldolase